MSVPARDIVRNSADRVIIRASVSTSMTKELTREMRIRSAKIDELKPTQRERALSPRQLAALQRDEELKKALARLKTDDDIIAIELDPAEKMPTMRIAVKKAIAAHRPGTYMAVRGRTIYVSAGKLPGGRGRPPKS